MKQDCMPSSKTGEKQKNNAQQNGPLWEGAPAQRVGERAFDLIVDKEFVSPSGRFAASSLAEGAFFVCRGRCWASIRGLMQASAPTGTEQLFHRRFHQPLCPAHGKHRQHAYGKHHHPRLLRQRGQPFVHAETPANKQKV